MAIEINSGDLFTPEQLSNHIKIYAGPGAGKTHFLVENIKNIVKTDERVSRSKVRKVLCITYTNAAVDEIKRRLDRYSDAVEVNTIHGFIIENIILPFQDDLKKIIYDEFGIAVSPKVKITSQIEGLGILHGYDREEIHGFINAETASTKELSYSKKIMGDVQVDIQRYLSDGKRQLKASSKISEGDVLPIKKFTWSVVAKLTHDEILYFGYRIVQNNSTATYALRVKFPFIFVDEFQDTNPLQVLLLQHLGAKSTIIGVIGDVAQSIYSFQGARPTQFLGLTSIGGRDIIEYSISGNRRSPENIVSLCNYLRSEDALSQVSIKPYETDEQKVEIDAKKIVFVVGQSPVANALLEKVISDGGVVITRSWAAAFDYIQAVGDEQKTALKTIYNEYYTSPIDIRQEIAEHNNVEWVRAFRFIIQLYLAYETGSFVDVLGALALYNKVDDLRKGRAFLPSIILCLKEFLIELFSDVSETSIVTGLIEKLNKLVPEEKYKDFTKIAFGEGFKLQWYSEYDSEKLINNLSLLQLDTVKKLFTQVFSKDSKYMTVHQAKGLEWRKVIVSVTPSIRNDKTTLSALFSNPKILQETPQDEFTRMYYVACSRATEELYIHLPDNTQLLTTIEANLNSFKQQHNCRLHYEIIR